MSEYELYHHGVKGQRWGVRRYQDKNGRLTAAGKARLKDSSVNYQRSNKSSKNAPKDMVSDAMAVNGGARGNSVGFNRDWNCAFCATAYELRRRGQDVQAQESLEGVNPSASKLAFIGLKKKDIHLDAQRTTNKTQHIGMTDREFDAMEKQILQDGDNSRGRMGVRWKAPAEGYETRGGHAFNYEVKDGKFFIVDPQVGQVLSGKDAKNYLSNAINVEHYRTDNLKVDNRIASKYFVENRSDIRINTEKEKAIRDAKAAEVFAGGFYASHLATVAGMGSGVAPLTAAGVAGYAINTTGFTVAGVSAARHQKKANKAQEQASIELEEQWNKENRLNFYATGKEKGRRKK